ncbi:hypothetical protein [Argonema galeatum]|uniref:hypothetical protein n=1 Tax=Argonema galeatum TaxID=2942762 RepID=UPI0020126CE3|nr:hypothetical protein [Argonema galeatum]MCL1463125.1 hypothetical protein [Argonema galeatum A003/A1]
MSLSLIISIAAIIVSGLVFTWLFKVVKATLSTAISIAIIVLILQLAFGIAPQELWQQIIHIPQTVWQFVTDR